MPRYTIHHSTITICVCYVLAALCLLSQNSTFAQIHNGAFSLSPKQLKPGASFDLPGEGLYKPGYAIIAGEKPEFSGEPPGFSPVLVPQLLNRIRWWLDDSADFQKHEDARLKK